jgi:hypothetical protein
MEYFGLTAAGIVEQAREALLKKLIVSRPADPRRRGD